MRASFSLNGLSRSRATLLDRGPKLAALMHSCPGGCEHFGSVGALGGRGR